MFEYGHLKCVELDKKEFAWFFTTVQEDNYNEQSLEEKDMLKVLNKLGKDNWELVSIDPTIGFIMKRRV